ncbi:ABC transporter ATP-binding protein [Rhodopseudomonas palustris]|uniref:ABC transporter ATP-binding protein n=1 Tax=Rhodopseudomonas palustris TaxID=1076 RepID=A0A418UZI2_RHOPL|nr:ABC transporter ATP-binding protein [Rhodopseudomonas palustris]RJF68758.1 ABC transporter ATP-binding protein [Rhodopseudomonas palustris]
MSAILSVSDLTVAYGGVTALDGVSLTVEEGEIVTVLGANGAGKTTLLLGIMGAVPAARGRIQFRDTDLSRARPHTRLASGLVLVPEGRQVLVSLTVEENLLLGAHLRRDRAAVRSEIDAIYERFPNLGQRRHVAAATLSGGEQQMLAIGRAMVARPQVLMLDEPSLGLSPLFVSKVFELIQEMNRSGLTIVLVEQNTGKALSVAHSATVLELGKVAVAGPCETLRNDRRLLDAYLGGGSDETSEPSRQMQAGTH